MHHYFAGLFISILGFSAPAAEVAVDPAPFEPPYAASFDWKNKFAHPKELIPPKYVFPEEMRSAGISGEVVALIVLKADGTPERISILYDTMGRSVDYPGVYFSAVVIEGLKQARWEASEKPSVWFYTKVKFELVEKGAKKPSEPGTVFGVF